MGTTPIFKIFKYALGDLWNPITESQLQANSIESAMKGMPAYVADATERDARFGTTPVDGSSCWRADKQWEERYFSIVSSSNPSGTAVAGWYPIAGNLPVYTGRDATSAITTVAGTNVFLPVSTVLRQKDITVRADNSLNIPVTGLYDISGSFYADQGNSQTRLYISGALSGVAKVLAIGSFVEGLCMGGLTGLYLKAGDSIGVSGVTSGAGNITTIYRTLSCRYVGPA